jgi:peptidoglycan/LPS O-acetylase OafA/YrhL
MKSDSRPLLIIDTIKALASQLIVWHHLTVYGPMSDVVHPYAVRVTDWLYADARAVTHTFLVIGGFLSARSLLPRLEPALVDFSRGKALRLLWLRYIRLARPFLVTLVAAILCAAIARSLIQDPDTPAAPTLRQVLAHLFLLQDILHVDALSAGVWYVAIDFQLYALFVALLWLARQCVGITGICESRLMFVLCACLTTASLFWINRDRALDGWAPYFFGAYGLGIFAQWIATRPRKWRWLGAMLLLVATALAVEWRSRVFVAGLTAGLLVIGTGVDWSLQHIGRCVVVCLGRISYSVFLIHYPVCLLVGALIAHFWPGSAPQNAFGLFAAWLLSLGAGAALYQLVERRR